MYARLWWKDLRQFWPIWLFLVVAAAAAQWLTLLFGVNARHGSLLMLAIFWTSLYALTAGAAAFAGEREVGGLRLLDSLPAPRRVIWSAKVSFAIVTSLALVLVLLGMAALNTDTLGSAEQPFYASDGMILVALIFFAMGWGLFFSAFTASAITAAVLGIVACGFCVTFFPERLPYWGFGGLYGGTGSGLPVLGTTLVTIAASHLIFTRQPRRDRSPSRFQFRSPIVINIVRPERPVRVQLRSPIAPSLAAAPRPAIIGGASTPFAIRQYPRSWFVEFTALAWQTLREGRGLWWLLFGVVGLSPLLLGERGVGVDPSVLAAFDVLGLLAAGVSVFGIEHQARSQRILAYHSARPRLVWLAKLSVWTVGIVVIAVIQAVLAMVWFSWRALSGFSTRGPTGDEWYILLGILGAPFCPFVIAMLCGMTIRRTITAGVIAMVFTLLIGGGCAGLIAAGLFPLMGLLIIPIALLGVSWAWAGDWMLDRPAPGRWLRLGGLVSGTFAVLFFWYIGYRAWGVSDPGAIAPPASWSTMAAVLDSPDRNAADLYRQAADLRRGETKDHSRAAENQRRAVELIRQAITRPDCVFLDPRRMTITSTAFMPEIYSFALVSNQDVDERMKKGDLAGAWASILIEFRLARHEAQTMTTMETLRALQIEQMALSRALEWSVDPRQTPELLQAAQKAVRELAPMPVIADVVSAEANILEQTFNLPSDDLKGALNEYLGVRHNGRTPFQNAAFIEVTTTPWELMRARRAVRQWAADAIQIARASPLSRALMRQKNVLSRFFNDETASPLVTQLISPPFGLLENDDCMLLGRRALVQVIAIRSWQFRHDGAFPERLEQLVPEELESLPLDPYSETPFGYVVSSGQPVAVIGEALSPSALIPSRSHGVDAKGWRLLYSVGPDLSDNQGKSFSPTQGYSGQYDYVFAIPPLKIKPAAKK